MKSSHKHSFMQFLFYFYERPIMSFKFVYIMMLFTLQFSIGFLHGTMLFFLFFIIIIVEINKGLHVQVTGN